MLDFDAKQLEAIGAASFIDRLRTFLAQEFADARAADPLALADEVRVRLEDARAYGLDTARAAATFLVLTWMFGGGFERDETLRGVLEDGNRSPREKLALLEIWALGAAQRMRGGSR